MMKLFTAERLIQVALIAAGALLGVGGTTLTKPSTQVAAPTEIVAQKATKPVCPALPDIIIYGR